MQLVHQYDINYENYIPHRPWIHPTLPTSLNHVYSNEWYKKSKALLRYKSTFSPVTFSMYSFFFSLAEIIPAILSQREKAAVKISSICLTSFFSIASFSIEARHSLIFSPSIKVSLSSGRKVSLSKSTLMFS